MSDVLDKAKKGDFVVDIDGRHYLVIDKNPREGEDFMSIFRGDDLVGSVLNPFRNDQLFLIDSSGAVTPIGDGMLSLGLRIMAHEGGDHTS